MTQIESRPKRKGPESGVGLQKHKRTATDIGIALLTPLMGQEFLDRYGLRDPLNKGLRYGVKTAFSAATVMSMPLCLDSAVSMWS